MCVYVCSFVWWGFTLRDTCFVSWSQFHQSCSQHKLYLVCIYTMHFTYTIAIKLCACGFLGLQIILQTIQTDLLSLWSALRSPKKKKLPWLRVKSYSLFQKPRKQHEHSETSSLPSVTGNLARKDDTLFRQLWPFNISNLGNPWWKQSSYLCIRPPALCLFCAACYFLLCLRHTNCRQRCRQHTNHKI